MFLLSLSLSLLIGHQAAGLARRYFFPAKKIDFCICLFFSILFSMHAPSHDRACFRSTSIMLPSVKGSVAGRALTEARLLHVFSCARPSWRWL